MALTEYLTVAVATIVATPVFAADRAASPWLPPDASQAAPLPADLRGSTSSGDPVSAFPVQQVPFSPNRTGAPVPVLKTAVVPSVPAWSWSGLYFGAHVAGALGSTDFADPFGASIFGDTVRTPGFLGGVQLGFNWQVPSSPFVFGVQADIDGVAADGTSTCFAYSASAINATCRVRPEGTATLTGRFGYAAGPDGRTLLYLKGGFAWADARIDMAVNNDLALFGVGPAITTSSSNLNFWGWTAGAGVEYALTPAWSLFAEYDYLDFATSNAANLGTSTWGMVGNPMAAAPPGSSGVAENIQEFRLGLNYKLNTDPWAPSLDAPRGPAYAVAPGYFGAPVPGWAPGWELETGLRYMYSWGQFHKDIGQFTADAVPGISSVSRLTYDDMQTNSGEFVARLDTPWNLFVKGFVGGGATGSGHMNDEDFGIPLSGVYAPYSNTLASNVTGNTFYGAVDAGYDFLHGSSYRLGAFLGYFHFDEKMNAFGCTPIANINCMPSVPAAGSPNITETDHWDALRIGAASDVMLTQRVKFSADLAYVPYAAFNGVDDHFFGSSGVTASINPESGHGEGAMTEAMVSYYFTPQFSVGIGGRYWALWTTSATVNRTYDATGTTAVPTPPQFFKSAAEQAGAFIQASYQFGVPAIVAARD